MPHLKQIQKKKKKVNHVRHLLTYVGINFLNQKLAIPVMSSSKDKNWWESFFEKITNDLPLTIFA